MVAVHIQEALQQRYRHAGLGLEQMNGFKHGRKIQAGRFKRVPAVLTLAGKAQVDGDGAASMSPAASAARAASINAAAGGASGKVIAGDDTRGSRGLASRPDL